MEDKNGLNDIILNKSSKDNNTKKILLTVATFAIILIIVIVVMNQISGKKESSLPHAPEVSEVTVEEVVQEPDFEEAVPVIENAIEHTSELIEDEETVDSKSVSKTAPDGKNETQRILEAAFEEPKIIEEPDYTAKQKSTTKSVAAKPVQKAEPKQVLKPKTVLPSGKYNPKTKRVVQTKAPIAAQSGQYYIQVGSFATYAPSKTFLEKIANRGYTYVFHKTTRNGKTLNKVLVGPFKTQSAAREALSVIKRSVEPGAFLTKI